MVVASCPFLGYYWEKSSSYLHHANRNIYKLILPPSTPPRAFSSGRAVIALSASHHITDTPIPWEYSWPFAELDPECPFLSYKGDSISTVSQQCLLEEKGDIPWAAGTPPTYVAQDTVGLQCCKDIKVKISKDISCLNNLSDRRLRLISFKNS